MTSTPIGESSLLLWVMAAVVSMLAAYLFVGWVRRAQTGAGLREIGGPALIAASSLGLGLSSAMVLALSAEGLAFPLGYRWAAVPVLVLGPMLGCLPAAWWLTRRQNWMALLGCGLLIGAVAVAVQVGWVTAAGFRPGLRWNYGLVGAAGALSGVGFMAALWLAYSDASSSGANRTLWRVGASVLMALTVIAGQELVGSAAGLLGQVGSVYLREAGATWVCLVAGALVPTILATLALDLTLRTQGDRRVRRHSGSIEFNLPKRRKRRRKYRAL